MNNIIKSITFLFCMAISANMFSQNQIEIRKTIIIQGNDTTITESKTVWVDSILGDSFQLRGFETEGIPSEGKKIELKVMVGDEKDLTESRDSKRIVTINPDLFKGQKSPSKKNGEKDDFLKFASSDYAHYAGFGIGVNGFMNANDRIALKEDAPFLELDFAKSLNFQFNVLEKRFAIYHEYIGLTTGIGFQWNRYALKNNVDLAKNNDSIFGMPNTNLNYTKNVMRSTYLQVPLLLEFNSNKDADKAWHLSAGVVGGIRIASSWKTKWENNGNTQKAKTKDDYHLNPFSANLLLQLGFSHTNLFIQYGLTEVFEKNKGPQFSPVTAGVFLSF